MLLCQRIDRIILWKYILFSSFSANHLLSGLCRKALDQNNLNSVRVFPLSVMSSVSDACGLWLVLTCWTWGICFSTLLMLKLGNLCCFSASQCASQEVLPCPVLMSKLTSFGDSFQPVQRSSIIFALLMPAKDGFEWCRTDAKYRVTLVMAVLGICLWQQMLLSSSSLLLVALKTKEKMVLKERIFFSISYVWNTWISNSLKGYSSLLTHSLPPAVKRKI